MIYTVTINPALDYILRGNSIDFGGVNRVSGGTLQFGGKGINVSVLLRELGCESTALGFTAGFTGDELEKQVKSCGVKTDFIRLESGLTRINVKLKSNDGETELNAAGPSISADDVDKLLEKTGTLQEGDTLILSGSTAGLADIYPRILEKISGKNIRTAVDTTGKQLLDTLKYRPWLIKPNLDELAELFGELPDSTEKTAELANRLREMGAQNVLVSMAAEGAVLVDEKGEVRFQKACTGKAVNSVGAGDSMLAGFTAGMLKTGDYGYALKLGTAAGAATAFSEGLGTVTLIEELLKQIQM